MVRPPSPRQRALLSRPARPVDDETARFPLRLSVAGGRLGIELYERVPLGPLFVEHLLLTLPGLAFPVDLSGGVRPFRSRRGELERLSVGAAWGELARWLAQRLRGADPLAREPSLWRTPLGIGVGFVAGDAAWAFELLWVPTGSDLRLVVHHPRAAGVRGPALTQILRSLDSVFAAWGERQGRVVIIPDLAARFAQAVLPTMGARAPKARDVLVGPLEGEGDHAALTLGVPAEQAVPSAEALSALELATLVREADDDLVRGETERARAGYVRALERAPRHAEITRCVAELDAWVAGRAEAALGLLVEALPATASGLIGAELLAQVKDFTGARQAIDAVARAEPYGPVAALQWLRLSELVLDAATRREALDLAVASCPGLEASRWARFRDRCRAGEVAAAASDAEHLEAAASGANSRHEVLARAGAEFLALGYVREAGQLFERALRYLPDHAPATLGLAQSLISTGNIRRAAALLERVLRLTDEPMVESTACLELAKLLALEFRDLPNAIARLRQIVADSPHLVEARAREGAWRAEIGDLAGASLAYARLREACELERAVNPPRAADWLRDAGRFEREVKGDWASAERHLAVALRLRPHDRRIAAEYRRAAQGLAGREPFESEASAVDPSPERPEIERPEIESRFDEAAAEALRARVLASPDDEEARRRLVELYEQLHKDEELFALLSAQRDEATAEQAVRLRPHLVRVLKRLIDAAGREGRTSELELYRSVLAGV